MEKDEVIKYWRESSGQDLATARDLLKLKHYHWALFVYHLAIEKLLKAILIKANIRPPFIHKLERLTDLAGLKPTPNYRLWLREITSYNLDAQYDDDKRKFYQKATLSYSKEWSKNCEEIYQWLQQQHP